MKERKKQFEIKYNWPAGLMEWLTEAGFFVAPASARYHGNYEGGLFDHSKAVMKHLVNLTLNNDLEWQRWESPIIVGLLHDICKCGLYKSDGSGGWIYNPADKWRKYGHGNASLAILKEIGFPLTEEEELCIRYHMGAYETDNWSELGEAIEKYHSVLWTHTADMMAARFDGI